MDQMADGPSESGFKSSIKSSKTHLFTANWFLINHGWLPPPIPDIRSIGHRWYASPSLCTLTATQCPLYAGSRQRVHVGRQLQSLPNELARCDWQLHPGIRPDPPGNNRMDGWMDGVKLEGCLLIWSPVKGRRVTDDGGERREKAADNIFGFRRSCAKVCISWLYLQPNPVSETLNYSHFPISE